MPSLVTGFEYDVFISYRQKDNKYDGWVTEFVSNLKKELEATFKEDISVYFDENPHDGLQENYDVDDSLREKLKCLVFIPIVSRTYCDPKSFAWQQEFKTFLLQATTDKFGMKVRLENGNTASRILPLRIHELGPEDVKLFESETQAVLRPIDFVFKSSGVNRPLLPDDKKEENVSHASYRDQINKTANAINEIISILKQPKEGNAEPIAKEPLLQTKGTRDTKSNSKIIATILAISLVLLTSIYFFIGRSNQLKDPASSGVAILPFRNNTGSEDLNYYGVGMASEIRTKLSMSKQFNIISSLQATLSYTNTNKSPKQIGDELNVDFILSGLYQKAGSKIKVEAELINAENGQVVWALPFEGELEDVFEVQAEIAKAVLNRFSRKTTVQSEKTTSSVNAFAHYIRGNEYYNGGESAKAVLELESAIELDSGYANAWVLLIDVEGNFFINDNDAKREEKIGKYMKFFRSHFSNSLYSGLAEGSYAYRVKHDYQAAINFLLPIIEVDPQNSYAARILKAIYKRQLNFTGALHYAKKTLELEPEGAVHWKDLGDILELMGDSKSSIRAYVKAWSLRQELSLGDLLLHQMTIYGLPIEQLPTDVEQKLRNEFKYWEQATKRNWPEAVRISKTQNNYTDLSFAYWSIEQADSAAFWANEVIRTRTIKRNGAFNTNARLAFLFAISGNRLMAFETLDNHYANLISSGDDKMSLCQKREKEILVYIILKEYPRATEELIKLNEEFPDFGNYGIFTNYPLSDKIRKEYTPFRKALDNLKRKPFPNVDEYIKF